MTVKQTAHILLTELQSKASMFIWTGCRGRCVWVCVSVWVDPYPQCECFGSPSACACVCIVNTNNRRALLQSNFLPNVGKTGLCRHTSLSSIFCQICYNCITMHTSISYYCTFCLTHRDLITVIHSFCLFWQAGKGVWGLEGLEDTVLDSKCLCNCDM